MQLGFFFDQLTRVVRKELNMSKRKKAAIQVAALSIICGPIIWHVVHWQATGMYLEMFCWIGSVAVTFGGLGLTVIMILALFIMALRYHRGQHIPTWIESLVAKED